MAWREAKTLSIMIKMKKVNLERHIEFKKGFVDIAYLIVGSYILLFIAAMVGILLPIAFGIVLLWAIPMLKNVVSIEIWEVTSKKKMKK